MEGEKKEGRNNIKREERGRGGGWRNKRQRNEEGRNKGIEKWIRKEARRKHRGR